MIALARDILQTIPISPWLLAFGAFVVYHAIRAVYLIYFSPLATFPGSKWAAVSEYWEAYWNIGTHPGKRGQTLFRLEEMHQRLGPAIRLGPNEVHVYDPRFYHELYRSGGKYYKDPSMHKVLGAPASTLVEHDPFKHKVRRAPLDALFSKANTAKLEPLILNNIDTCSRRFDEFYTAGKPVHLEWALKSLAMDTVSQFAFGRSFDALEDRNFQSLPVRVFVQYLHALHVIKAFPFVRMLNRLPLWIAKRISKDIELGHELEQVTAKRIEQFLRDREKGKMPEFPTMMERLLIPIPDKGYQVPDKQGLRDEILTILSAGTDTTGISNLVTIFNVINSPEIHRRLLTELRTLMPKPESVIGHSELEKLPYLSAVIKEGLRFASPAASRTPRLVPPEGVMLPDGRFVPAGTRVGMSIYHIHYNESIFSSPRTFDPERWLKPANEIAEQNKFHVAFSRGTRACAGINLAYMEMYMAVAHIIRRFELTLAGTTAADMRWDDMVVPQFYGDCLVMTKRREN